MAAHILSDPESHIGKEYVNEKGDTQCVEFIKQTLKAPATSAWTEGTKVTKGDSTIACGTAIATFVDGKYPQLGSTGKHAAIYLEQDSIGLIVVDQWKPKDGKTKAVAKRTIKFESTSTSLSNQGTAFSVIEW